MYSEKDLRMKKYTLKFLNNPKFQKEFKDVSSIYSWAKGYFRNH